MRIKENERKNEDGVDNESNVDSDTGNGIPLYSSLESLLNLPLSMSSELSEKAMEAQDLLDRWSMNRREVVKRFNSMADELDEWDKGCAISTTVGSSVGIASGAAVIGGLIVAPYLAVAGFVVGTVAGASNLVTGVAKNYFWKTKIKDVNKLCDDDKAIFETLMELRKDLLATLEKFLESEEYHRHFSDDTRNNIKNGLGAGAFGAAGLGARFMTLQMGRLSSSLVKGILHGAAAIGIILDTVSLAVSANELIKGEPSKLGEELRTLGDRMELDRQKIVKDFLNHDVWDAPQQEGGGQEEDQDDKMSETGSFVTMGMNGNQMSENQTL